MTLTGVCSLCGYTEDYNCNPEESRRVIVYEALGRSMGYIQDVFPNIPAWIRSSCIDQYSGGFCICPKCQKGGVQSV